MDMKFDNHDMCGSVLGIENVILLYHKNKSSIWNKTIRICNKILGKILANLKETQRRTEFSIYKVSTCNRYWRKIVLQISITKTIL